MPKRGQQPLFRSPGGSRDPFVGRSCRRSVDTGLRRYDGKSGNASMIGRLNHVAIVVPDLAAAAAIYRGTLGARVSEPQPLPEHGVTVVFVELPNTKIELLEPLGADSPIAKFLEKNSDGGMHHVCYEVEDIR